MKNKRVCLYVIYEVLRVLKCHNRRRKDKNIGKLREKETRVLQMHEKEKRL